jgi:hypothetical protein
VRPVKTFSGAKATILKRTGSEHILFLFLGPSSAFPLDESFLGVPGMAEFFQSHFQQSLQPREKQSVKAKVLKSMSPSKVAVETDLRKTVWHLRLSQIFLCKASVGIFSISASGSPGSFLIVQRLILMTLTPLL